jgi:hypothetical protein
VRKNEVRDLEILRLTDERKPIGRREIHRKLQEAPPKARVRSLTTLGESLSVLENDALIRIESGSDSGRGYRSKIFRTPQGTKKLHELSKQLSQESEVRKEDRISASTGELDILTEHDFRITPIAEYDHQTFLYSKLDFEELLGQEKAEDVIEKISTQSRKIIEIVEDAVAEALQKNRKSQLWSKADNELLDFLERRESYEKQNPEERPKRRPEHIPGEVRKLGKELRVEVPKRTPPQQDPESYWLDKLGEKLGALPHLEAWRKSRVLAHVPLSKKERSELQKLRDRRYAHFESLEDVERAISEIAVLSCNHNFQQRLLLPPGKLVYTGENQFENIDHLVRKLSRKQLTEAETDFWEAAYTAKYSHTVNWQEAGADGEVYGGTYIEGPNAQFVRLPLLRGIRGTRWRRLYFKKIHAALRSELNRRGCRPLPHNEKASAQELIDEINEYERRNGGIVPPKKEESRQGDITLTYAHPNFKGFTRGPSIAEVVSGR